MSLSSRKTTFMSFIYKGLSSGLGFINGALTARYLDKQDRGLFQLTGTISLIGQYGAGGYTNYYGYALPKQPEESVQIAQTGNALVFGTGIVIWLITTLLTLLPHSMPHLSIAWIVALYGLPLTFMVGYGTRLLNALDEIAWLNRVNLLQPLLFFIIYVSMFVLDRHRDETTKLLVSYQLWLGSYAITVIATMLLAYRKLNKPQVFRWKLSRAHVLGTLSYGSWASLGGLVNYVNYRVDFWIVGAYVNQELAVYGAAVTAAEVLNTLTQAILTVVFRAMTGGDRETAISVTEGASRQTLITSTLAAIPLAIVFPFAILFGYGHAYSGAIIPFFILLPGLVFRAASNIIIQYATNSIGRPRTTVWMNLLSIVINAIVCVLVIPPFGIIGGAIASTASYVLSFIVYVYWFGRVAGVSPHGLWKLRAVDFEPYLDLLGTIKRRLRR